MKVEVVIEDSLEAMVGNFAVNVQKTEDGPEETFGTFLDEILAAVTKYLNIPLEE